MRVASKAKKRAKAFSRRTLSMILAGSILVTMIIGVISGMLMRPENQADAYQNPVKLDGLNRSVVVQQIDLLPVDDDASGSRTTLYAGTNGKNSGDYSDIVVNADGSVDFNITATNTHNKTSTNNTSFVEAFTLIQQKINLAENPWLMVRWSGSGRCNGRIYFTVTYNGTEYGNKSKSHDGVTYTNSSGAVQTDLTNKSQQQLISSGSLFQLPLSNIINNNNAGYNYVNQTQTDFNAGTVADYSIDLYKYISEQVSKGQISLGTDHWPTGEKWLDASKYYVTVYMSCQIVASEANQSLQQGVGIHWEKFALGREVMKRPASMLPRSAEFMNITDPNGNATEDGRVSKLDDGSVTFSNTSASNSVMFEWNLRRYFNATELEALHIEAVYSGANAKKFQLKTWFGGTTTYRYKSGSSFVDAKLYAYRGTEKRIDDFVNYPNSPNVKSSVVTDTHCEVVGDFNGFLKSIADDTDVYPVAYSKFYPEDSLIFIDNLKLTLPAGCKITFTRLEFQVENDQIPATQADTVYPWVSAEAPNGLPPVGTPAYSTALNGGTGMSYDWATAPERAPVVKNKIDLLAMKTYSWSTWNGTVLSESEADNVGVAYTRKTDGSSIYSSTTIRKDANGNDLAAPTTNSYYKLMRFGPSNEWNRNYYMYLDVAPKKDAAGTYVTPYLYYSYELIDKTPNDGIEPQAGFYFHFQNACRDTYVNYNKLTNGQPTLEYAYQYYLDHSGVALNECSSVFSLAYEGGQTDDSAYEYGAKAILSNSLARTGCIDISSLWVEGKSDTQTNGQYLKLEALRIYLAPGTEIKLNYFFVGSDSLNDSVVTDAILPREGGISFPWAVSKADFDKYTSPDSTSKQFTFANKVDLFKDIQDRVKVSGELSGTTPAQAFPGATVDSATGAVTVTVTNNATGTDVNTGFLKTAGTSYDHIWKVKIADENDLASMRYLNYSVSAPAGMRWSIMFCESNTSSTDQRAILTWCDSDARWNDDDIYTAAPAGRTYFRIATADGYYTSSELAAGRKPEYDTYWKNEHNTSWRIYSIPGSQTGCVDMRQVTSDFEWNNLISIYLVAYQDPNVKLETGESPSVTFNYLYLTSTPIEANAAVGRPATTAGTIYNWGNTKVTAPSVTTKKSFSYANTENWGSTYPINYKLSSADESVNLATTPYLYYSYRLLDKRTGKLATLADTESLVSMWIIEQNTYYYQRNTAGADSNNSSAVGASTGTNGGYGKPSFIRRATSSSNTTGSTYCRSPYFAYAAETGCINLADYFTDDTCVLNQIRFVINNSLYQTGNYELVVDYLFLGTAAGSGIAFSQTWTPVDLARAPKPADYRKTLIANNTGVSSGTYTPVTTVIDLDETPYLFYSLQYAAGTKGTFGLTTNKTVSGSSVFYRDAARTDGVLISAGSSPSASKYMLQSETGCIDVREWYITNGIFSENTASKVINVSNVRFWGSAGTVKYMYFGALADKTIDLIPSQARGRLKNGLPTRVWVVRNQNGSDCELIPGAANSTWDVYDTTTKGSGELPPTKLKFQGDLTGDGYNDLRIQADAWSQIYIRYGNIINKGSRGTFAYSTSGNNQMSGLLIDLNETPYLHFSFEQAPNARTSMVLQTTNNTTTAAMNGQTADKTRPWLSAYCPTSPAGQLISVLASTNILTFYKDSVMVTDDWTTVYGDQGGVIDLRSWYSETNGYGNVVSMDSIRFYTYDNNGIPTDLKIKHLYLSTSASAAYAVTFHKNDGSEQAYTQHVIQNANEQFVDDSAVSGFKVREGYTFLGWYTDELCEQYFDILGTPLTGNVHLYARWVKNTDILSGKEVNLLENMDFDNRVVVSGSGTAELDDEKLSIQATGDLEVKFNVNKAYSVKELGAVFAGFDIDKTCKGFDIILDAKCASSQEYSLIQDAFRADYLTANGLLTAAPYDREMALYTYLGVRDDLPTRENVGGLIEINSISVKVPAGVSVEIRYIKAANEMALQGKSDVRAPAATKTFDLLANTDNDPAFVNKSQNVVYNVLDAKSLTYHNIQYTQSAIHAIKEGYVHLGGLYDFTIDMTDSSTANPGRYLYFSIDQPDDSYVTFAIYTAFSGMVEGNNAGVRDVAVHDVYTMKAVSYYSKAVNGLVAKDSGMASDAFMPVETAYINGNLVGKIDLYNWYKDALVPYRSNSQVTAVELLGIRFFTSNNTTDANINYFFIGNDETELSKGKFDIFAESGYLKGQSTQTGYQDNRHTLSTGVQRGETLYVTLDELTNIADDIPLNTPTYKFVGWVFRDIAYENLPDADKGTVGLSSDKLEPYVVYWNPEAKNGNMYHPTNNPYGSWYVKNRTGDIYNDNEAEHNKPYATFESVDPMIPDYFNADVKSVFYTFSTLRGNTQVILPVFETSAQTPSLSVKLDGTSVGTVSIANTVSGLQSTATNNWTAPFASDVVVRADGGNFIGWFDEKGDLLSTARDYHVSLVDDTTLTAKFGTATTEDVTRKPQSGKTIVWLQSLTGTAGTDFYLKSINTGKDSNVLDHVAYSNVDDLTGVKQIACYWNLSDSQVLTAVAPSGYHWEQLLSDDTTVRVTDGAEYTFIVSTNIKLVAVANSGTAVSTVIIDEFAFDDNRTDQTLRFNGQAIVTSGEELVSCGIVFTNYRNHGELPSVDCAASSTITATAWNSTTGQFVVEFSIADNPEYVLRGYAVVRKADGSYAIRYSECVATVF